MPLTFTPSDVDLGDLGDLDVGEPSDGDTVVYDDATGTWQASSGGGSDLSDDAPLVAAKSADPGTSGQASRGDHVHPSRLLVADDLPDPVDDGTLFVSRSGAFLAELEA